jgi:pimeloyl-ACP methyl ester carboxylesterase
MSPSSLAGKASVRGDFLKQFMAADGATVAYEDEGRGPPLVLLHGFMAHSGFFMRQRELAAEFRLINVDLRDMAARAAPGARPP